MYDHSDNESGEYEDEKKKSFSPEFHFKAARLVVDQGCTVKAASDAMGVGKWQEVRGQLRDRKSVV